MLPRFHHIKKYTVLLLGILKKSVSPIGHDPIQLVVSSIQLLVIIAFLANLSEMDEWKWLISFAVPCLDGEAWGSSPSRELWRIPPGDPMEPLLVFSQ